MAPEVLEGKEFSTSADVYSFGIVLWEIYTRKEPFNQFRNYQKFKEAVVRQGEEMSCLIATLNHFHF